MGRCRTIDRITSAAATREIQFRLRRSDISWKDETQVPAKCFCLDKITYQWNGRDVPVGFRRSSIMKGNENDGCGTRSGLDNYDLTTAQGAPTKYTLKYGPKQIPRMPQSKSHQILMVPCDKFRMVSTNLCVFLPEGKR